MVDASGTVVFQYDGLGRISQTDKALDGTTYTTQSTYDGLGRLLTVTYPSTPAKTISYAYNGPVLDRVFEGTTTYIQYTNHNALGQAGTTTYGNGVSTTTTYANANNMVCSQQNFRLCTLVTTAPGTGGGGGGGTSTTYNAQADFSSVQGQQGWYYLSSTGTQLTWNGNFWQGTDGYIGLWNDGGHPGSSTDAVRRWVAPSAGNVRITGNASHGETCGGDGTTVMIKKNGSLLWSQAVPAGTTVYSFDLSNTVAANDQIEFVTNKNTDIYCDNTIFTPTIVLTTGGGAGGTAYQDLRYVYGPNGNVSDIYDNTVAGGAGDQHLSYDSLDRLTLANGPYGTNGANASFTYTYDELGNLTLNSQVGTYSYPTSGASSVRPHAVTTAGSNSYSYDANGNLTSGAGRTLAYNLENKPLTITIAGQTTTFVYDGDGGRVKKTAGSTVTRYIGKLYECDNTSCSRVVFAGGQRIATIGASGAIYYYHSDHLGSSSVITDSAGTNVQSLTYFPYGATRTNNSSATPAIDVPYKYTGKELDSSTNLYYYEARYYDPTLGRFLSADTIVPNPRDPQDLNRYTYAGNNPLRYTDPTGHFKIKFNKFFKRAFGDVGTAVIGAVTQVYGPLLIPGCGPFCAFVAGGTILSQSKSGRYVLAGEIVAASVVASVACGGCGLAVGAAVGSTLGAGFGGYSAARNGGDISSGILFGAGVGAVTGAIQGAAWTVPFGPSLATGQTAAFFGSHIGAGALVGAGSGATVGYAGGAGNVDTILSGTARGAVVGAAVATILAGIDYAGGFAIDKISVKLPDFGSPPNPEVNHVIDLAKVFGGLSAKTVQALSESPLISGLAVSGASGGDVLTGGVLSNYALGELGKKGGHCTYGSEGVECGLGSKAK